MESEKDFFPNFEKPKVLYHASQRNDIEIFEPRSEKVRDRTEGPRVFATPDKAMATVFLISANDSWTQSGARNGIPYLVIGDEARFRELDHGGTIYSLPSDSFEMDPDKGLRELEWTSGDKVTPIAKEEVSSALEAMLDAGVQVYFTDMETIKDMQEAQDHGEEILMGLKPFQKLIEE